MKQFLVRTTKNKPKNASKEKKLWGRTKYNNAINISKKHRNPGNPGNPNAGNHSVKLYTSPCSPPISDGLTPARGVGRELV